MSRESLDAPENLAKEGPCQVTFRELYDVERRASAGGSRCRPLNQVCVQASQSLVVAFLRKDICLEPMQRGRERDARVSPLPGRERPQGRVLSKSLRVVGVLVPSQAAIDRLTKQIGQRELKVMVQSIQLSKRKCGFRRSAIRNMEHAGVSQAVAMKITGHRTDSVYRRYRIVDEQDLRQALERTEANMTRKLLGTIANGGNNGS